MNQQQINLWNRMRVLIRKKKRKFQNRKDRNIYEDLNKLGLSVTDAWNEILTLNKNMFVIDNKPFYNQSKNSLTFKKKIKYKLAYIKLMLDENDEVVVCWSFHEDNDKS